jgi:hypothetical protein
VTYASITWRGFGGNREVLPMSIRAARGDLRAAWGEAYSKEGGARGKHGFPRGSERQASDVIEAYLGTGAVASG